MLAKPKHLSFHKFLWDYQVQSWSCGQAIVYFIYFDYLMLLILRLRDQRSTSYEWRVRRRTANKYDHWIIWLKKFKYFWWVFVSMKQIIMLKIKSTYSNNNSNLEKIPVQMNSKLCTLCLDFVQTLNECLPVESSTIKKVFFPRWPWGSKIIH